jgi:2-haloacid dehalogenase
MVRPVVVFDVNETLLDLAPIGDAFDETLGDADAAGQWFARLLELSWVAAITGEYHSFAELGGAAVQMVFEARGLEVEPAQTAAVVGVMRRLPPHPDVAPGLDLLADADFRLAALTNSPSEVARAQLEHAGLIERFERLMSVEMVATFKPSAEVYRAAAAELGVETGDMVMVAAHAWDIAGAMAAGCRGAFVSRPGRVLSPLQAVPDLVASDVTGVARLIIQSFG